MEFSLTKEIYSQDANNKPVKTVITTTLHLAQPSNSLNPATSTIEDMPDGTVKITTSTGSSQDISRVAGMIASINSLSPLIWVGTIVMACSLIGIFIKEYLLAAAAFVVGGAMVACAFLLQTYGIIILIVGIALFLGVIGYIAYKYFIKDKSNRENVSLIEAVRKDLPRDIDDKFFGDDKPISSTIQSPSTVGEVARVKAKENLK